MGSRKEENGKGKARKEREEKCRGKLKRGERMNGEIRREEERVSHFLHLMLKKPTRAGRGRRP